MALPTLRVCPDDPLESVLKLILAQSSFFAVASIFFRPCDPSSTRSQYSWSRPLWPAPSSHLLLVHPPPPRRAPWAALFPPSECPCARASLFSTSPRRGPPPPAPPLRCDFRPGSAGCPSAGLRSRWADPSTVGGAEEAGGLEEQEVEAEVRQSQVRGVCGRGAAAVDDPLFVFCVRHPWCLFASPTRT